ncbi:class I SAM-dependent methyltransferase [Desulfovibrio sp.]|uniref:tRNA (mnm(5)s(2)U34)-methyltransferase n=1 Tax=Desulfovibrio sp. TaxID=885 RepID=UPI0025BA31A7|nr:class I SAM-dependent methyltransferase [Desulfovibrio sp.]
MNTVGKMKNAPGGKRPDALHAASGTAASPVRRLSLLEHLAHAALERALATCVADASFVPHGGQGAQDTVGAASGPLLVDATAGNGHDSLFLLGAAPRNALLLAMDVQAQAVAATGDLLAAHGFAHAARVLHTGHECLADVLAALAPEDRQRPLVCAVFNLGWQPGGNKGLVTTPATSLPALEAALDTLAPGGCISLHCYTGHEGGAEEAAALEARVRGLPPRRWRVLALADANRERAAESLLLVERLPVRKNRA